MRIGSRLRRARVRARRSRDARRRARFRTTAAWSRIRTATCCCTRSAMRCSARWDSATSASISPTAIRAGRAPTAARFVRHCAALLREHGWRLVNADLTVLAESAASRPSSRRDARQHRRRPRRDSRRRINIKATTSEGLGALGRARASRATPSCCSQRRRRASGSTAEANRCACRARRRAARCGPHPHGARGFPGRRGARLRAGRARRARAAARREARRQHRLGRCTTGAHGGVARATSASAVTRIATPSRGMFYGCPVGASANAWQDVAGEGYRVLAAHRHARKLRPGRTARIVFT